MRETKLQTWLIARPAIDWKATEDWIESLGGRAWIDRMLDGEDYPNGGESLIEAAGRRCYRSFDVGLNPNVTRVRTDSREYLQNGIIGVNHGCYDDQTEVLTLTGWKLWRDVTLLDKLATRTTSGVLEYHQPRQLVSYPYSGMMYTIFSRAVDLMVTPNHKMLVTPLTTRFDRKKTNASYRLEEASEISGPRAYVRSVDDYLGLSTSSPPADVARILGFAVGDGTWIPRRRVITFHLRRKRKIEWLRKVAAALGWSYRDGFANDIYKIRVPEEWWHLFAEGYDSAKQKQLPSEWVTWPREIAHALLEGWMEADGSGTPNANTHRDAGVSLSLSTTSTSLAAQMQQLALHSGYAATVKISGSGGFGINPRYCFSLIRRELKPIIGRPDNRNNTSWVPYDGVVYCAEVPNHTLYVRRNGITVWSGNSVLEHAQYTFALEGISRVLTHELVRHRVGVAISQESLRYVRLDDIPFWWPDWAKQDAELYQRGQELIAMLEDFQVWQAEHFKLDDEGVPFTEKKAKTSFMRRFAPEGLTTGMVWSANVRALRHVIKMRTDPGAEEEIRIFGEQIRGIMLAEAPYLFEDMIPDDPEFEAALIKAMTEPIDPTTPPTSVIT